VKVIWVKEALERLTEIEEFIAQESPVKAEKFIDFLIEHTAIISQNPEIGRIVPEISNPIIREIIVKKYRIVYRINNNQIEILTVFEGHRLLRIDDIAQD